MNTWKVLSGAVIAAGTVGFLFLGGTAAGAGAIVSAAVILVGAGIALWQAITKGKE